MTRLFARVVCWLAGHVEQVGTPEYTYCASCETVLIDRRPASRT